MHSAAWLWACPCGCPLARRPHSRPHCRTRRRSSCDQRAPGPLADAHEHPQACQPATSWARGTPAPRPPHPGRRPSQPIERPNWLSRPPAPWLPSRTRCTLARRATTSSPTTRAVIARESAGEVLGWKLRRNHGNLAQFPLVQHASHFPSRPWQGKARIGRYLPYLAPSQLPTLVIESFDVILYVQ